jgi:hypothetical protein
MMRADLRKLVATGTPKLAKHPIKLGGFVELKRGRIHEVTGTGADMFAVLAAAKQDNDVLWLGLGRDIRPLCPSGLEAYLDVERILLIEAVSRGELLWAADQALRAAGGFCIVLDMPGGLSLKESRRLQLAAEQGGGLDLIARSRQYICSADALALRACTGRPPILEMGLPEGQKRRSWNLAYDLSWRAKCHGYSPYGCRSFPLIVWSDKVIHALAVLLLLLQRSAMLGGLCIPMLMPLTQA